MNPTLLYNNYHIERRKMFESSPRNNLFSTIDFTWRNSIEEEMSPREKMEFRKQCERKLIGEKSNQLIARRLKKQISVDSEGWVSNGKRSSTLQVNNRNSTKNHHHNSHLPSITPLKDTLNQQVQNFNSSKKLSNNKRYSNNSFPVNPKNHIPPPINCNNYTRQFDPQLQSLTSRQSMASSELSELIPKGNNYLGKFLNLKLEKYLINGVNSMEGSLDGLEEVGKEKRK